MFSIVAIGGRYIFVICLNECVYLKKTYTEPQETLCYDKARYNGDLCFTPN